MVKSQERVRREADNHLNRLGRGEVSGALNSQCGACDIQRDGIDDERFCTKVDFIGVRGSNNEVDGKAVGDGVVGTRRREGDLAEWRSGDLLLSRWSLLLCCSEDSEEKQQ